MKQIVLSVLGTVLSVIATIFFICNGYILMGVIMILVDFECLCIFLAKKEELDSTRIIYREIEENYNSIQDILEKLVSEETEERDYCLAQSELNKRLEKLEDDVYCLYEYFYKYLSRKEKRKFEEIIKCLNKDGF